MFFRKKTAIPETMKALVAVSDAPGQVPVLLETEVPGPGASEVLVAMSHAPIHPADLVQLRGRYGTTRPVPFIPGLEGSGVVVKTGGGLAARALLGRRVAVLALSTANGTWAPYTVVPHHHCVPLLTGVSLKQGAVTLINPLTAMGLLEPELRSRQSVLVTVASGALGRMILSWGRDQGLHMIGCVRQDSLREELKKDGFTEVFNSSSPEFPAQLRVICRRFQIRTALDATGGPLINDLLQHLEEPGKVVIYGLLSREQEPFSGFPLLFRDVRLEGFWLQRWWARKSQLERLRRGMAIQMKPACFATPVHAVFAPLDIEKAMISARTHRSDGKTLLCLNPDLGE